jgi:hypothetical protein
VEQRAAYNLAQAYLALAPQPSVPPQERVSEAMVEAFRAGFGEAMGLNGLILADKYIHAGLTAALAPLRRAPSGDGGGEP